MGTSKKISLRAGSFKKNKKRGADANSSGSRWILKVLAVIVVLVAVGSGLVFLDNYVSKVSGASARITAIQLVNPPAWLSEPLKEQICTAATAGIQGLKLDENTARLVQANLTQKLAWLVNVKVQATHDRILIHADYRKPIAMVKVGLRRFYVDADLVVLDFVPMPNLTIIEVKGLSPIMKIPVIGQVWQREDLAEAIGLLVRLGQMDKLVTPDKPLLSEIANIDVSNFKGRQDKRFPHIVLYAKDNTEIIWGAEAGAWAQHFEARDEEKLAKLYNYYKQRGSLLNGAKYINLRDPQSGISLPIDRY
jgi:hypothetical protein